MNPCGTSTQRVPQRWPLLERDEWTEREARHHERVDAMLEGHLHRRRHGIAHPVEDFLFTYYSHRPGQLRRWHPGVGVGLARGALPTGPGDSCYTEVPGGVALDVDRFLEKRGTTVAFVSSLLRAVNGRPAHLGCFGLHEWAMVYRLRPGEARHSQVPLRLGHEGTDRVVESHRVRCSHFDAYRFFTDEARPRNELRPTRDSQVNMDQPGCLHANMDLYKWAYKLAPAVPSELVADCFELARDVRELDMRASPYDLTEYGYTPVRIETREGKAEYTAAQRRFAERASGLRSRLLRVCELLGG
ncbi:3-methyladenine DNA glycosylase [Halostreptopolyspora alba]|uniref:3-methyladenine DNA glycosylase n=1 Tax=Halostreptopolyspora alba TaxID=2487137 RepID=A0A3N0DYG3_9ACTN|nr:3-methyladenine DNA glycosylase [Nocardiopsaceae bacterium YIM 96095]